MKKAIYTVIINEYDVLEKAPQFDGWDCFLFTDKEPEVNNGWTVILVNDKGDFQKTSRKYKMLVHENLPNYDLFCYIDGSGKLINEPPTSATFILHPYRTTIEAECKQVIKLKKDKPEIVKAQLEQYKKDGFPDNGGLYANGFFVRPNNDRYNSLFESWFKEIEKWSYRDQISFPYVIWKSKSVVNRTRHSALKRFVRYKHHRQLDSDFNIHYITPGRPDKLYGLAVNDIVKHLPSNDWICLRDIDTLVLDHETLFRQLKDIIKIHGKDYDLLGAKTNDIGLRWQLHNGEINKSYDLTEHYEITKKLADEKYNIVSKDRNNHIAGFFMLFSKAIWERVGGFPDEIMVNGKFFDYIFSKAVRQENGRIGICEGVYIYHFKRYGKNPRNVSHLIEN